MKISRKKVKKISEYRWIVWQTDWNVYKVSENKLKSVKISGKVSENK